MLIRTIRFNPISENNSLTQNSAKKIQHNMKCAKAIKHPREIVLPERNLMILAHKEFICDAILTKIWECCKWTTLCVWNYPSKQSRWCIFLTNIMFAMNQDSHFRLCIKLGQASSQKMECLPKFQIFSADVQFAPQFSSSTHRTRRVYNTFQSHHWQQPI